MPGVRGLYAITPDLDDTALLLGKCEQVLKGGATLLQYRNKKAGTALRREQAFELAALCRRHACLFIVNDDARNSMRLDDRMNPGIIIAISGLHFMSSDLRHPDDRAYRDEMRGYLSDLDKHGAQTGNVAIFRLTTPQFFADWPDGAYGDTQPGGCIRTGLGAHAGSCGGAGLGAHAGSCGCTGLGAHAGSCGCGCDCCQETCDGEGACCHDGAGACV